MSVLFPLEWYLILTQVPRLREVLPETLEAFAVIKDIRSNYDRIKALTDIAPNLPPELLPEAFDIFKGIPLTWDHRIRVLITLISPISKMPKDELLSLWQTIKHWLSQKSGQELAHYVLALSSVIYAVGGQEAVVEALIEI